MKILVIQSTSTESFCKMISKLQEKYPSTSLSICGQQQSMQRLKEKGINMDKYYMFDPRRKTLSFFKGFFSTLSIVRKEHFQEIIILVSSERDLHYSIFAQILAIFGNSVSRYFLFSSGEKRVITHKTLLFSFGRRYSNAIKLLCFEPILIFIFLISFLGMIIIDLFYYLHILFIKKLKLGKFFSNSFY